jgi:DNA-binding XRE family transcriptional regulator
MAKQNLKNKVDWYLINKIKERRNMLRLTQVDLAIHLEVSSGFIGQVESPKYRTKYKTSQLNELAKLLKCSPKDFWPEKPI